MSTLRDVRQHILGVKNTKKVTHAMKVVAATKLRRFEEELKRFYSFRDRVFGCFEDLMSNLPPLEHPLLTLRPNTRKEGIIIVSSDRGLCGPFNHTLLKESLDIVEDEKKRCTVELFVLGIKGIKFFTSRGPEKIAFKQKGIEAMKRSELAQLLAVNVVSQFLKGAFDRFLLVNYRFESRSRFGISTKQLLPIPVGEREPKTKSNFLCEPSEGGVLDFLLSLVIQTRIDEALLHSFLSEEISRMVAMEYATDNADKMIQELTLQYHRVRQAMITREVSEVVGGAEALAESG